MAEIITKDRKEYNIWDKINGVWNRLNFLTNAKSVDFDDGKTAQNKLGAINGITSDLTGEAEDIAASIKCVNQLNSSLEEAKNSLVGVDKDKISSKCQISKINGELKEVNIDTEFGRSTLKNPIVLGCHVEKGVGYDDYYGAVVAKFYNQTLYVSTSISDPLNVPISVYYLGFE